MARKARRKMAVVNAIENEAPEFADIFNQFVESVAVVHGRQVAQTYRSLREQEAMVLYNTAAPAGPMDYPEAKDQLADFMSFRISNE